MRELHALKELQIWQQGIELARKVHHLTDHIVENEDDDIVGRLRRDTVLLSALIADGVTIRDDEGPGRAFMRALDSIGEVEETLCISVKRGYLQRTDMHAIRSNITELNRMITEVINA